MASDAPFHEEYSKTNISCGIDLNLSNFVADSDGNIVDSTKYLKRFGKKLKKAQRKLPRKYESAKRDGRKYYECKSYKEQRIKVAELHIHIANHRKNFHQTFANYL